MLVQDHEVIQQLVERFQINRRQMDSKIQLRLHPVELGKMEIDITVKEGSIRANVVAQSQHVQEIVERNIAKLKTVLEKQGFSVEEITVTSESDSVDNFDLFDQQLPNQATPTFLAKNDLPAPDNSFDLDDFQENEDYTESGLNVKA
jgi:flagellar hook-length control protein FliK